MDHAKLRAAVTAYFREQLQRAKERRDRVGPFSPEERAQTEEGLKVLEEGNSEYWHLLGREHAQNDLDDFFRASGLPRNEYAAQTPRVLNEIRLGRIGAHKAILDHVAGLEAYDFSEAQSGMKVAVSPPSALGGTGNEEGAQRAAKAASGSLLSEMFAARQAEADRSEEWGPKLRADYSVWVGLFMELIGDRPIDSYRKADARAFKEVLQELPANRSKYVETAGLGIREAVQAGKKHSLEVISTSTVNKGLGRLQAIWKWADKQLDADLPDIFGPMKVAARGNCEPAWKTDPVAG
ncbi:MAG: hypothetical protein V2I43_15275 [Parvularcula sp.]|nr:hypothetical protein [Parvularcula sp.]